MAATILTKSITLNANGYRGGSFNGAPSASLNVGGNDSITEDGYNYLEYITTTFDINTILDLSLNELKTIKLTIKTGKGNEVNCQYIFNSSDYIIIGKLVPNTASTINLDLEKLNLTKSVSVLISAKKELNKVEIVQVLLEISYRELGISELPTDGKYNTLPNTPELEYYTGDISLDLFENCILLQLKDDPRKIINEIEIYTIVEGTNTLLDKISSELSNIKIPINSYALKMDTPIIFRARSKNYNGYSEWSDFSEPLLKTSTPNIKLTGVSGANVIVDNNQYIAQNNINFNFNSEVFLYMQNTQFELQHYYNGKWLTIPNTSIPYTTGMDMSIPLDLNNENENGGMDKGEYRNYRIKVTRGLNTKYSNYLTVRMLSEPNFIYSKNAKYKRIPILPNKYKLCTLTTTDAVTSEAQITLLFGETYNKRYYMQSITFKNSIDIYLPTNSLLNNKVLNYGDKFKLEIKVVNPHNLYTVKIMDTVFQLSEKLDAPIFNWKDLYTTPESAAQNLYFKDTLSLYWNEIKSKYFPKDNIIYSIYLNGKLALKTTKTNINLVTNENTANVAIAVSNGFETFNGNNKTRYRVTSNSVWPALTQRTFNIKTADSTSTLTNSATLPLKMLITWSNINSSNTLPLDMEYILGIYNHTKSTLYSTSLFNYKFNKSTNLNEAIVDLGVFNCQVGDNIQLYIMARDRFGFNSASATTVNVDGVYKLNLSGTYITNDKIYKIKSSIQEPLVFGADYFPTSSDGTNWNRNCPAICADLQPSLSSSNGRSPLLVAKFFNNYSEFDYKFILTAHGTIMETIDSDSDNIYPKGLSNKEEYRLLRFLGLTDNIDIDGISDKYWHDLICTKNNTLVMVGNRGEDKILRSTNNGIDWLPIKGISNNACLYSICERNGVLYSIGERWTPMQNGSNYYLDNDGNMTLKKDSEMNIAGSVRVFTPTIHNNENIVTISRNDGLTWTEHVINSFEDIRHINANSDMIWALSGNGNGKFYKSTNGIDWTTETLPGNNRCYTSCSDNLGNIVILSIDNINNQTLYLRKSSGQWQELPCPSGCWYSIDYNPKAKSYIACSLDGKIMTIDKEFNCHVKKTTNIYWYKIKYGEYGNLAIGGYGDKFRIAFCPNHELNSWVLKKSPIKAYHNLTYIPSVNGFMATSYEGQEGGIALINYLRRHLNEDLDLNISIRYYNTNGKECYNLPESILPHEEGFNAIRISSKLDNVSESSYDRGQIIYANNYQVVTDYLIKLLNAYTSNYQTGLKTDISQFISRLIQATPLKDAFIGTYEINASNLIKYLETCKEGIEILDGYIKGYVTGTIPEFLLPFYGLKNLLSFDRYVKGNIVYKDAILTGNIDKTVLGLNGIIDMLAKI